MKCKVCGETETGKFYSSIRGYCKDHWKEKVKANREKNRDYYREYERKRTHDPKRISARKYKGSGKIGLYCVIPKTHSARGEGNSRDIYRRRNPKKSYAQGRVAYLIKIGELKREPCEVCGDLNVHAHHDDYSKPESVRWLCDRHHKEWHKLNEPKG